MYSASYINEYGKLILLDGEVQTLNAEYNELRLVAIELYCDFEELSYYVWDKIERLYYKTFGDLRCELQAKEIEFLKFKLMQTIKKELTYDTSEPSEEELKEMTFPYFKDWDKLLSRIHNKYEVFKDSRDDSHSYEILREMKRLYYQIALRTHPNFNIDCTKSCSQLFKKAQVKYRTGDFDGLRSLYDLAIQCAPQSKTINDIEKLKDTIIELKQFVEFLTAEIDTINKDFPMNKKEVLFDSKKIESEREDMARQIRNISDFLQNLKDIENKSE